jgi:anti-anti-sigma regulatory factor
MLRITVSAESETAVTLKLEGQIASAWVPEFAKECRRCLARPRQLSLDFRDVTYIDAHGRRILGELRRDHVDIVNCPTLIRELLDESARK